MLAIRVAGRGASEARACDAFVPVDPMPFTPLVHIGTDADALRNRMGLVGESLLVVADSSPESIGVASEHLASNGLVLVTTSAADAADIVRGVGAEEDHVGWLLRRWNDSGDGPVSLGVWEGS